MSVSNSLEQDKKLQIAVTALSEIKDYASHYDSGLAQRIIDKCHEAEVKMKKLEQEQTKAALLLRATI